MSSDGGACGQDRAGAFPLPPAAAAADVTRPPATAVQQTGAGDEGTTAGAQDPARGEGISSVQLQVVC